MIFRRFKNTVPFLPRSTTAEPGLYLDDQRANHGMMEIPKTVLQGTQKLPRPSPYAKPDIFPDLSSLARRLRASRVILKRGK